LQKQVQAAKDSERTKTDPKKTKKKQKKQMELAKLERIGGIQDLGQTTHDEPSSKQQ